MIELLRQRRSIRQFQSRPIEAEKQQLLLEAALRAPSSRGTKPWQFILVNDPQVLHGLADSKQHGSNFLGGAPLAIVVAANPHFSDVWVEDCSIAATLIQMAAVSLGLGSCWVQIRLRTHDEVGSAEDYLCELLGIPDRLKVECVLGLGYPAEDKPGHPSDYLLKNRIHENRYEEKE